MNTLDRRAQLFMEGINNRLNVIAEKTKTNEFSGKNIMAVKSIVLQIMQAEAMTLSKRKVTILDILIAVEELTK